MKLEEKQSRENAFVSGLEHFTKEDVDPIRARITGQKRRAFGVLSVFLAGWFAPIIFHRVLSFAIHGLDQVEEHGRGSERERCGLQGARGTEECGLSRFNWDAVLPSSEFKFVPCYGGKHECAKFEVPLDYNATSLADGPRANIAVIRKPAIVDVTDPRYGGVIFTNPGGPGASGISFHLAGSDAMRNIVDTPAKPDTSDAEEKYWDLVSFDPRGIGLTTPRVLGLENRRVFEDWRLGDLSTGCSVKNSEIFDAVWSRGTLYGRMIADGVAESHQPGSFLTTAIVVQDMVEMLEAYGRWREARASRLLDGRDGSEATAARERTSWKRGEELLNFWGISYGTYIGQTFATLQPHRVGRVLLDGVVDAQDHADGKYLRNLVDVDSITRKFAEHCITAGPKVCPIAPWAGPDRSIDNITSRIHTTITDLKNSPLAFYSTIADSATSTKVPSVITYSSVLSLIFTLWYAPLLGFPAAAQLLHALDKRDPTLLLPHQQSFLSSSSSSSTQPLSSRPLLTAPDPWAPSIAIRCTDAHNLYNITKPQFHTWQAQVAAQSPLFSDFWSCLRMPCHGFEPAAPPSGRIVWRFGGPFGARTRNPMLFAGQALDPVTPMGNAEVAATELFPGAGVLRVGDGAGHSISAWPSRCAVEAVRGYFGTGEINGGGVIECEVSVDPFGRGMGLGELGDDGVAAMLRAGRSWVENGFGLGHLLSWNGMARSRLSSPGDLL